MDIRKCKKIIRRSLYKLSGCKTTMKHSDIIVTGVYKEIPDSMSSIRFYSKKDDYCYGLQKIFWR